MFDAELLTDTLPRAHALDAPPAGGGEPIDVTWQELENAADEMDAVEATAPKGKRGGWAGRLRRVKLLVRDVELSRFTEQGRLRIDRLLHLVGMVGAGKSTLRDILTYHLVTRTPRRVTIVVGDVAETLAVVRPARCAGGADPRALDQGAQHQPAAPPHRHGRRRHHARA
ncbi:hypothetical protein [Streptomyces sp. AA0539]|uniref:hypothetical protein n=1 Tax=Streptomyces sp. AA0539 TaxID=1210045 RepID=UPI003FD67295